MNVGSDLLALDERRQLDEQGYLALARCMSAELLGSLRQVVGERFALEGDNAGSEFKQEPGCKRLANCVFYAAIYAKSPEGLPGNIGGLTDEQARLHQALASKAVQAQK